MISAQDREIQALVADVRDGRLLLPELQRRYVWKATQVRDLFDSLYRQYPSGQLLVWQTTDVPFSRTASVAELDSAQPNPQLLLDGQQRLTSLTAVLLGKPLLVRGLKRPIDVAFNLYTEKFEVAGPRQRRETGWISLSKLYTQGAIAVFVGLKLDPSSTEAQQILGRLTRLDQIKSYKYRVNVLENLSYAEVTHIFVRINSGGATLGGADLALAQVSSRWRGVVPEFEAFQEILSRRGLVVDSGLLLRAMTVLATGQSKPSLLFRGDRQHTTVEDLQAAWQRTTSAMKQAISFLTNNCHVDKLSLLPTNLVLIPLVAFFDRFGSNVSAAQARELQRWVYMALIWSRYNMSTESVLDQDVAALSKERPIDTMIQNIEDRVGKRPVTERELQDQRKNSPFMMMAYVLARRAGAQDWFNGVAIGASEQLEFHHIFPKALLRDHYDLRQESRTVDQVANLVFLSRRANSRISTRMPYEYLEEIDPERLKAQYVPQERELWALPRFEEFLLKRRTLLADAINDLLQSLTSEPRLWPSSKAEILESRVDALERLMRDLVDERITEARGPEAWDYCVPKDIRSSIENRLKQRLLKNPFQAEDFNSTAAKLSLCQFSDYARIIKANWAPFADVFGDWPVFEQHIRSVTTARNAFKHHTALTAADLLSAEAGLVWIEECLRYSSVRDGDENADKDDMAEADAERSMSGIGG